MIIEETKNTNNLQFIQNINNHPVMKKMIKERIFCFDIMDINYPNGDMCIINADNEYYYEILTKQYCEDLENIFHWLAERIEEWEQQ